MKSLLSSSIDSHIASALNEAANDFALSKTAIVENALHNYLTSIPNLSERARKLLACFSPHEVAVVVPMTIVNDATELRAGDTVVLSFKGGKIKRPYQITELRIIDGVTHAFISMQSEFGDNVEVDINSNIVAGTAYRHRREDEL